MRVFPNSHSRRIVATGHLPACRSTVTKPADSNVLKQRAVAPRPTWIVFIRGRLDSKQRPRAPREPGLGAAKSFVDDFFWPWWCFEISVFNLVSVGRGYRIDETMKLVKVASIGALDGLLDAVVARN